MSPSTPASPGAETVTVRFWASARAAVGVAEFGRGSAAAVLAFVPAATRAPAATTAPASPPPLPRQSAAGSGMVR